MRVFDMAKKFVPTRLAAWLCALTLCLPGGLGSPVWATSLSCPGSFQGELSDGGALPDTDVLTFSSVQRGLNVRVSWIRSGTSDIIVRATPGSPPFQQFVETHTLTNSFDNISYSYTASAAAASATITLDAAVLSGVRMLIASPGTLLLANSL